MLDSQLLGSLSPAEGLLFICISLSHIVRGPLDLARSQHEGSVRKALRVGRSGTHLAYSRGDMA